MEQRLPRGLLSRNPGVASNWRAILYGRRVDASTALAPPSEPNPGRRSGRSLHRFANPGRFLRLSGAVLPFLSCAAAALLSVGLIWGLLFSPADWQQGDAVRIMYVHVPAAWLASSGYLALAVCSLLSIVWRHPLADLAAAEIGPVGASFTVLCLATGSLWGKPMWGAWWVWDARLTSVLVLFFLYLGHIALVRAFDDPERGYRSGAILALVGVVNLPIIKFSVDWWNTLHQPASITLTGAPTMSANMLWPLLIAALGYTLAFASIVLARTRAAVMERRIRGLLMARAHADGRHADGPHEAPERQASA
jgi:heme exporter protein C